MAKELRVLELFAGIGACSKALTNLGIPHKIVDAVEIDKYAIKSFNAIHGTDFVPQDISQWDKDLDVDLIMHGSPCQDFSVAGRQAGGDEGSGTRSSLMYETLRIVEKLKPKYVIWENVKNLLSKKHKHNFDAYLKSMEDLGYHNEYKVLNAKDYGIPQNRERVFTVSIRKDLEAEFMTFRFPNPIELKTKLNDILEPVVDEKFYLSDKALACFMSNGTGNYPRRERFLQNIKRKNREIGNAVTTRAGSRPTDNFVTEPVCVASRGRGENNEQHLEPRRDGVTNTITTVQKDNYVAEPSFISKHYQNFYDKYGYTPEMFNPYNESEIKDVAPTQTTKCGDTTSSAAVLIDDTYKNREPREYEDYSPTLRAGRSGLKVIAANKQCITNTLTTNGYRIRKLTPLECWRLMGFDDEDFEKAEQVNSNAQLYKQAGNSIVVNVLMSIIQKLFGDIYDKE